MSLELAQKNLPKLVAALGLENIRIGRVAAMDRDLYHCFTLLNGKTGQPYTGEFCYVEVPGVELAIVKTANLARAKPLYVNGVCWYWQFAIGVIKDLLLGVEE